MAEKQMIATIGSTIEVENPCEELMKWVTKNGIIDNPEYIKKKRMNLYLANCPQKLLLYMTKGSKLIVPYGWVDKVLEYNPVVVNNLPKPTYVNFKCRVPLYDYQKIAVDAMEQSYHGVLQSPAGSGKTQMGIALAAQLGVKTLWLTHTRDLLNQSKERAELYMDKSLIGTITEGRINIGPGITFATIQTMANVDLNQLRDEWDCVIVDECHRVAGTQSRVTRYSKVLNALNARHKYGLSATVHRSDGTIEASFALLGNISYKVPDEAVKGRVMQVSVAPVATNIRFDDSCYNTDGTISYTASITYLTRNTERNEKILKYLTAEKGKSSLILSERIEHLQTLMNMLPTDMREQAVLITGKMTNKTEKAAREKAIKDMVHGRKLYLFATYSLAKEGLDIPRLCRLYMATPQSDYAVIVQSVGRIARTCEGKLPPVAYDFVDADEYSVRRFKRQRCRHYAKLNVKYVEVLNL